MKHKRELVTTLDGVGDEYVLNMQEVGAILDLHPTTVSDMCARGVIAGAFRAGNRWRLQARELREHIKRSRVPWNRGIEPQPVT